MNGRKGNEAVARENIGIMYRLHIEKVSPSSE
jgi:hypothetical protein